jgi:hypothetical protein
MSLRAPFPWFGGKSKVADIVWQRFGPVANYVEPFAGSLAVMLGRPDPPGVETVNDIDGFICNFWRALRSDPEKTAEFSDWPSNENDLHARHAWLCEQRETLTRRLEGDPDYCDFKIAGWWVWGIASWIGSGWCAGVGPWLRVETEDGWQLLHLGTAGMGVQRQLLHLGDAGNGLRDYFQALADRLNRVRVCSGDWTRVCGPSVTHTTESSKTCVCGVFLDPPYSADAGRDMAIYARDSDDVAHDVRAWCEANGDNPQLRIAMCGYAGEGHDGLVDRGWSAVPWKAVGGYSNAGNGAGKANSGREVIWFSPACLSVGAEQAELFAAR